MEDMFTSVPELKNWQANVTAVSSYYRSSGLRTKELSKFYKDVKSYPPHHEVRLAYHLISLCEALIDNLDSCQEHWKAITDSTSKEYNKNEKATASGFLSTWGLDSPKNQLWLTAVMIDICSVFRYIEKECQKPEIIAPDILKYRDTAVSK